jgi:RNA polymerase sigma-70 factor (ECF subfamily)
VTDCAGERRNICRNGIDEVGIAGNRLMDMDSETLAAYAAQTGGEQAWRQLFEWHFEPVYRFCMALAGGRGQVAEEVAHQVFVTAARRIHRFDPHRGTFRAWLLGIARNRHMKLVQSECRRKRREESFAEGNSRVAPADDPDLRVHEALARLPSHYRLVLEAKYLRGRSMKEIAADDGATVEAIESLLRRARAGFARVYEQMCDSG